jgi:hypothetical protein
MGALAFGLLGQTLFVLAHRIVSSAGLRIWGSPVQPEFNNWAFNLARGAAMRYWKMIPENTEVLVTQTVELIKPRLHVFGHIHGGHGSSTGNETRFVNASVVNEAYRLVYEPQVVEIEI